MPKDESTVYDEVLYGGHTHRFTHPDNLGTLAFLFGLNPQPVDKCRVLEIGCGEGTNLISMAYGLPQSEFLGIDLAEIPIANGSAIIQKLRLPNISLRCRDLMDCDESLGKFDYIIAHGVYSWVPSPVQDGLLMACRSLLREDGVAMISYNTYPGFFIRQMLREMMLFHVDRAPDPSTKLSQARAFCRLLMNARCKTDALDQLLKKELESVIQHPDGLLYHDDLAAINRPVYFHQFVEHAGRHGLKYLAEAEFFMMQDADLTDLSRASLRELDSNRILREQYLDFVRVRRFRQTLVCNKEALAQSDPVRERIWQVRIDSSARLLSETVDVSSDLELTFKGTNDATMTCGHPVAKAAMLVLVEAWPRSLAFNELVADIKSRLASSEEINSMVEEIVWIAYGLGVVDLHRWEPHLSLEAGERPVASGLARLQAENGVFLTNLRHQSFHFPNKRDRFLIQMLDGSKDKEELATALARDGFSAEDLERLLSDFGRMAFLL